MASPGASEKGAATGTTGTTGGTGGTAPAGGGIGGTAAAGGTLAAILRGSWRLDLLFARNCCVSRSSAEEACYNPLGH